MDHNSLKITFLKEAQLEEAVRVIGRSFGIDSEEMEDAARLDLSLSFSAYPYHPVTLIALQNDNIVGAVQCLPAYFHFSTYAIAWMAVDPACQGQGIGKALMNHAEEYIRNDRLKGKPGTIILTSRSGVSTKLYDGLGYKPGQATHNGAPVMIKNVNPPNPA